MKRLVLLLASLCLCAQVPGSPSLASVRSRLEAEAARGEAFRKLAELCDLAGPRLSGSPGMARAVALAQAQLKAEGLKVWTEPVKVPRWVRGAESASMMEPYVHRLGMLGLGGSVGTPKGGLRAEVLVVSSFEELDRRAAEAKGRIVLFDVPYQGYGKTVPYRGDGPSRAAKHGAVACLIRAVGSLAYDLPHTGALSYEEGIPKIPAAALTYESATLLHRLADRGKKVAVQLDMEARMEGEVETFNVLAELPGREKPEEIILVSGHLDSWDVGQGAQDDGVGCVLAMETAAMMKRLQLQPRRTVRVVLFANEENGLRGGRAYAEAHRAELSRHVAALESDSGNGAIEGFGLDLKPESGSKDSDGPDVLLARFQALGAGAVKLGHGGADIGPLKAQGVTCLGVHHDTSRYFDIHHTHADTLDKVDPDLLAANAAKLATFVWAVAEMDQGSGL